MKQIDLMESGENIGWCAPYHAVINGIDYWEILNTGKIITLKIGDVVIDSPSPEQIQQFAMTVNEDYSLYKYYSDREIIAMSLEVHEEGCTDCPFCDLCDAMQDEVDCD